MLLAIAYLGFFRRLERRRVATHKSRLLEVERRCQAEERMHEMSRSAT